RRGLPVHRVSRTRAGGGDRADRSPDRHRRDLDRGHGRHAAHPPHRESARALRNARARSDLLDRRPMMKTTPTPLSLPLAAALAAPVLAQDPTRQDPTRQDPTRQDPTRQDPTLEERVERLERAQEATDR